MDHDCDNCRYYVQRYPLRNGIAELNFSQPANSSQANSRSLFERFSTKALFQLETSDKLANMFDV